MDSGALEAARRALRLRFLALMSVQACYLSREDESLLTIHTWMNMVVHVRVLTAPTKLSVIKKYLKDATDVGIGTVFLLNRAMLPEHHHRVSVPEWLLALHTLTQERVYSFKWDGEQVALGQLHFEPVGSTGEYAAKYGPPISLDKMRYFRTSIKPKVIKGDWHIVDFGSEPFWKDPYRPSVHQPQYQRPDPSEFSERAWKSWSGTTWDAPPMQDGFDPRQPRVSQDALTVAYAQLKIERDATQDEVRAAYRKLALVYHPDTSTLPTEEAAQKFRDLNAAYALIQKVQKWD